jgi:hypothetical protein
LKDYFGDLNTKSNKTGWNVRDWLKPRKAKQYVTKGVGNWGKFFNIQSGELVAALTFNLLEDTLICIDDFDRKSKELNTKEVLGLVSYLKEQRDCKVVLIFNEETLNEEEKRDYRELREKVIDYEVEFSPEMDEVLGIVFNAESNSDNKLKPLLEPHIRKLKIRNIRILTKIKLFCSEILSALKEEYEPKLINQALSSSILFGWCFYSRNENAPEYSFVKEFNSFNKLQEDKESCRGKLETEWGTLLREYGYYSLDDFDAEIALSVERNFIDKEMLNKFAEPLNLQFKSGLSQDSFFNAYNNIFSSFDGDKNQLVENLVTVFKSCIVFLSPMDLNGAVELLRELGFDGVADELIDFYINSNSHRLRILDLGSSSFAGHIRDKTLVDKFKETYHAKKEDEDFDSVLIRMSETRGWNPTDIESLASAKEDELYTFFKNPEKGDLDKIFKIILRLENVSGDKELSRFYEKAIKALKQIGNESQLNKLILKRNGIDMDNKSDKK